MKKILSTLILNYFVSLRAYSSKNPRATIIGITGSAGKTSTRLAIVHILKLEDCKTYDSCQLRVRHPLNILGLTPFLTRLDWLHLIMLAPSNY